MKNNLETITKIGKRTATVALAGGVLLGLLGCEGKITKSRVPEAVVKEQKVQSVDEAVVNANSEVPSTITGTPCSVAYLASHTPYLAIVLKGTNESYLLATASFDSAPKTVVNVAALVQSEINDGDKEEITITGHYAGTTFIMKSIWAQGYQIDF